MESPQQAALQAAVNAAAVAAGYPAAGPMDTLTGYPVMAQKYSTGLLAPYAVGWGIALIAYGIVLASFVRYLQSSFYPRDSKWKKALTWGVVILNTGCAVQIMENTFYWSTLQRRNTTNLEQYNNWGLVSPILSGIIAFTVQGVYAFRSYKLFETAVAKTVFVFFISLGMIGGIAGSFMLAVLTHMSVIGTIENALPITFPICSGIWLWCSAFVDITNTATLCILLRRRVKGWSSETDNMVKSIVVLAVETAMYTSLFALIGAVLSISWHPSTDLTADYPAAFWIPLPSLYAVSLFTTMTSRDKMQNQMSTSQGSQQRNTYTVDMQGRNSVGEKTANYRASGVPQGAEGGLGAAFDTRTGSDGAAEEGNATGGIQSLAVHVADD
ncbi:hypothetical protein RQP46_009448 [Phenoliferia psychrophenolica]